MENQFTLYSDTQLFAVLDNPNSNYIKASIAKLTQKSLYKNIYFFIFQNKLFSN